MKTFAKTSPKDDPIKTPGISLRILSLYENAFFEHASFNNFFMFPLLN